MIPEFDSFNKIRNFREGMKRECRENRQQFPLLKVPAIFGPLTSEGLPLSLVRVVRDGMGRFQKGDKSEDLPVKQGFCSLRRTGWRISNLLAFPIHRSCKS